jgi:hypothetical protein
VLFGRIVRPDRQGVAHGVVYYLDLVHIACATSASRPRSTGCLCVTMNSQ